jgi:hypothetical protein
MADGCGLGSQLSLPGPNSSRVLSDTRSTTAATWKGHQSSMFNMSEAKIKGVTRHPPDLPSTFTYSSSDHIACPALDCIYPSCIKQDLTRFPVRWQTPHLHVLQHQKKVLRILDRRRCFLSSGLQNTTRRLRNRVTLVETR